MGFLDLLDTATKPFVKMFGLDGPEKPKYKQEELPKKEGLEGKLDAASRLFDKVTGATPPERVHRLKDYEDWGADSIQKDSDRHAQKAAGAVGKMQQAVDRGDHDAAMRHQSKVGEEAARAMHAATQAAMAKDEQLRQEAERYAQQRNAGYAKEKAEKEAREAAAPKRSDIIRPRFDELERAMKGSKSSQTLYVAYAERLDIKNKNAGVKLEPGAPTLKQQMEATFADWNASDPKPTLPKIDYAKAPRLPPSDKEYTPAQITANQDALAAFTLKAREEHFNSAFPFLADQGKAKTATATHKAAQQSKGPAEPEQPRPAPQAQAAKSTEASQATPEIQAPPAPRPIQPTRSPEQEQSANQRAAERRSQMAKAFDEQGITSKSSAQEVGQAQSQLAAQRQGITREQDAQFKQKAGGALYERGVQDVAATRQQAASSMSPQELASKKEAVKAGAVDLKLLLASMNQAPMVSQQQQKKRDGGLSM